MLAGTYPPRLLTVARYQRELGDLVGARVSLERILEASAGAGLRRFLFHNHGHLTAAEWSVIARRCGTGWDEDPAGYWPPATPKPSSF